MTDPQKPLEETLAQLHEQLEAAEQIDSALVDQLQGTVADIQAALQRQEAAAGESSLGDPLQNVAMQFEESHPTIAGTLRRLVDLLGQMGI